MAGEPVFRNSLVIGALGGIGAAMARCLEAEGGAVTRLSRRDDGVDLTNPAAVEAAAAKLKGSAFDLIVIATGALAAKGRRPEKSFAEIDAAAMTELMTINAVGPALAIAHFAPLLRADGRSVLAALSARVGSIGDNRLGGWMSYRASKAALNQIVRCAAIEIASARPQAVVAALHPGTVETPLTRGFGRSQPKQRPGEAAAALIGVCAGLTPAQSGGFFAYDGAPVEW